MSLFTWRADETLNYGCHTSPKYSKKPNESPPHPPAKLKIVSLGMNTEDVIQIHNFADNLDLQLEFDGLLERKGWK